MALYYCAGAGGTLGLGGGNLFGRGTTTCDPAVSADSAIAWLYDDDPRPFVMGSAAADGYIALRNTLLTNGGFEAALGSEWVDADTGTGASAAGAAGSGRAGGSTIALECAAGASGVAARYQPKEVRAGERLRLDGWIKPGAGASNVGALRVQNTATGNWLVGGAWQASAGDAVVVDDVATWERVAETIFTVEAPSVCLSPTVTLRIYCRSTVNATVAFDDIALIPGIDTASLHGHNLTPNLVTTLRYSDDAFAADDQLAATFTLAKPTCYMKLGAPVYREYWRIKFAGTPITAPRISEAWIGCTETAARHQNDRWPTTFLPDVDAPEDLRSPRRYRRSDDTARRLQLDLRAFTSASYREWIDDVCGRTYWGALPLLIVPDSAEERVIYGRLDPRELALLRTTSLRDFSLSVTEMGFPTAV